MASSVSFHLIFTRGIGGSVIIPISQMGKLRLTEVIKNMPKAIPVHSGRAGIHIHVCMILNSQLRLKLPLDSSCADKNPFLPPHPCLPLPQRGEFPTPLPCQWWLASTLSSFSRSCHKRCFLSSHAVSYSTNNLAFLKGTLFPLAFPQLWREENRNCKNIDKFSDCRLLILRIPSSQDGLALLTGTMPGFPSSQLQAPTCWAASCLPTLAEVYLKLTVHDDLTCWGCLCFSFYFLH